MEKMMPHPSIPGSKVPIQIRMECKGCGNQKAYGLQIKYTKEGVKEESCNKCGAYFNGLIDVYFKQPYVDEHLASEEHPEPKHINSRSDKKYWLEKCGLRESGDRVHGANNFDRISHRHGTETMRKYFEAKSKGLIRRTP
jgi:hypothetical protein